MAGECKNYRKNLDRCNCTYSGCSRKGTCCECIRYHLSMRQLPGCAFSAADERTYDRSISRYLRAQR